MTAPPATVTVDLQTHSTASDGAVAPSDIPRLVAAANVSAFALTDHDSVAGVPAAIAAAAAFGVRVVPGVELSVTHLDREVHLLGLHLESITALEQTLIGFRAHREERAAAIVQKLNALGVAISYDDVTRQAAGAAVGRPHVARALIALGVCTEFREAFDRYLGAGRPAYVGKPRLSMHDAVSEVHAAGGIAVWAHPGPEGRREMLELLVADGLDGVEVRHPGHSPDDVTRLSALCDHFKLVPSGGSDWHGEATGRRSLGAMQVPGEWLERQDALVTVRRAAGVS